MKRRSILLTACLVLFVAVFTFTATAVQYEEAYAISCNCTLSCCGGEGSMGGFLIGGNCVRCDNPPDGPPTLPCCVCACY